MKKLYEFYHETTHHTDIEGVFFADEGDIENLHGKSIYIGDDLDINIDLDSSDFVVKSDDQEFIKKAIEIFGYKTMSGYNPLDYYKENRE